LARLHEPRKIVVNRINIFIITAIVVGAQELPQLIKKAGGLPNRTGGFHGKFFLDLYPALVQASQSARGLPMIDRADVSNCSGFIPQVLRDS
jgi:hypothetical protein